MGHTRTYNYIIAGAGASGLILLWHMMHDLSAEKRILVIDEEFRPADNQIWSFWSDAPPFLAEIAHKWKNLEVKSGESIFSERLRSQTYYSLRSEKLKEKVLHEARNRENITLLETSVTGFSADLSAGTASTEKGDYKAEWIFQSILKGIDHSSSRVDNSLVQHFTGWEIETEENLFNPDTVTLMDLNTKQKKGLTFFYILPFSKSRAMIEYTVFSESPLEKGQYGSAINLYLKEKFGLERKEYSLLRRESGIIPMEDRKISGYYNSRTLNIGTIGGLTKPTTGYTLSRILDHSRKITDLLRERKAPDPFSGSAYRYRVYDILLLYLLRTDPESCREIFHLLFEKNSIETVLRFLSEKTALAEELTIFSKMPYIPFFKAIYNMKYRILTGA